MTAPKKDVSELFGGEGGRSHFTWQNESPEEKAARLRNEEKAADFERWRGRVTHVALTVGLFILGLAALVGAFHPQTPLESRQFATAALSTIVAGTVGYFTGKGK